MKEHLRTICFLLICVAVVCCSSELGSGQSNQTIQIPPQLLNQLIRDDQEIRSLFRDGHYPDNNPAEQFSVELVDLNGDNKPEYFVSQSGGNSSSPLWIYRRVRNGYQQILKAAFMKFRVLDTSANGYHDVELSYGGNAMGYKTDLFAFTGRKYTLKAQKKK